MLACNCTKTAKPGEQAAPECGLLERNKSSFHDLESFEAAFFMKFATFLKKSEIKSHLAKHYVSKPGGPHKDKPSVALNNDAAGRILSTVD
jgi:hypothetical protein